MIFFYFKIINKSYNIRDIDVSKHRAQIGYIGQEPVLFNMSIHENIAYGNEFITTTDIEAACKLANIYTFIQSLPQVNDYTPFLF